jgi:hypothetical protein
MWHEQYHKMDYEDYASSVKSGVCAAWMNVTNRLCTYDLRKVIRVAICIIVPTLALELQA